jgi:hypothetical protein
MGTDYVRSVTDMRYFWILILLAGSVMAQDTATPTPTLTNTVTHTPTITRTPGYNWMYIPDLKLGKYKTADQIPLTCVEPANTPTPAYTVTDNAVARFDGTSASVVQGSGVSLDDNDNMLFPHATYVAQLPSNHYVQTDSIRDADGNIMFYNDLSDVRFMRSTDGAASVVVGSVVASIFKGNNGLILHDDYIEMTATKPMTMDIDGGTTYEFYRPNMLVDFVTQAVMTGRYYSAPNWVWKKEIVQEDTEGNTSTGIYLYDRTNVPTPGTPSVRLLADQGLIDGKVYYQNGVIIGTHTPVPTHTPIQTYVHTYYVPYSGAIANVDLGARSVTAGKNVIPNSTPTGPGLVVRAGQYTLDPVEPDDISGLSIWFEADKQAHLDTDGQAVTYIDDDSPNGYTYYSAPGIMGRPSYETNECNGYPVFRWAGDAVTCVVADRGTIFDAEEYTLFLVQKRDMASDCASHNYIVWDFFNLAWFFPYDNNNFMIKYGGDTQSPAPPSGFDSGYHIVSIRRGASSDYSEVFVDNASVDANTYSGSMSTSGAITMWLFSHNNSPGTPYSYCADSPCFLFYKDALSDADYNGAWNYLSEKYAIGSAVGAVTQTADLTQWQSYGGAATLAGITKEGDFYNSSRMNNYAATAAPDADDDVDSGYGPGSLWIDIVNHNVYVCTDGSDGAANWEIVN